MKSHTKKIVSFLSVLTLMLTLCAAGAAAIEGDGTPDFPLKISTAEELLEFAERVKNGETTLYADLIAENLEIGEWAPIDSDIAEGQWGTSSEPGDSPTPYAGVFNGYGHKLTLTRRQTATSVSDADNLISNIALFHTIAAEGVVKNLNLDVNFYGYYNVAGVAVRNYGTIERVTVKGKIESIRTGQTNIAGIVAFNGRRDQTTVVSPAKILHCVNYASVTAGLQPDGTISTGESTYVAGIASNFLGEMRFCGNEGKITGGSYTGGLTGGMNGTPTTQSVIIFDCYNAGEVYYPAGINNWRGGLLGYYPLTVHNWGSDRFKISNVFSYGEITKVGVGTAEGIIIDGIRDTGYGEGNAYSNFSNIYYREGIGTKLFGASAPNGGGFGTDLVKTIIKSKTEDEFASAKMAELLNNGRIGAFAPWEYIEGNYYPTLKDSDPPDDADVVSDEIAETISDIVNGTEFTATDEVIVYEPEKTKAIIANDVSDLSSLPTGGKGSVISQSDFDIDGDGRVYVSPNKIKALAAQDESLNKLVNSDAGILPMFMTEVTVNSGETALFSYSMDLSRVAGAKIGDLTFMKVTPYGLRLPVKVSIFADLADERYIITDEEGAVIEDSEVIIGSKAYILTVGVKDDGNYDWDTTDGHILDPYAVGAPAGGPGPSPVSGSGGGCDTGAAGMTILAVLGMAMATRRRSR
jgi:hypothetical protein